MTSFLHLDALRDRLPDHAVTAPSVSGWSVGRHLEHCALAIVSIVEQLEASRPPAPPACSAACWPRRSARAPTMCGLDCRYHAAI